MIISHLHKLIFTTTPKSGSLTGFVLMREYFNAVAEFNHRVKVPKQYKHYHNFTFVRNPYERFCALYHSCVVLKQPKYMAVIPKFARKDMVSYIKWCISLIPQNSYPQSSIAGLYTSQSLWHERSEVKEFIHIEEANKIFNFKYPELKIIFPHVRKREHVTWDEIKTEELTYLINKWASLDFELYNYAKVNISS